MKPLDCVGIDPARSDVGKHDFQPSTTEPIVHGVGQIPVPAQEAGPNEPGNPTVE